MDQFFTAELDQFFAVAITLPPRDFMENAFAQVSHAQYAVDFRALPAESQAAQWFRVPKRTREIGSYYENDEPFQLLVVPDMYDIVAFVRRTTPAIPTPTGVRGPGR